MLRLTLTADQRQAIHTMRHDSALTPAERDRVEMLLLSAAGWSPPRIATHLGYHAKTVRLVLKRFLTSGPESVCRAHPGPAPNLTRRAQVEQAVAGLLAQDRTWTAAQVASALRAQGIALSTRQTRKYLTRIAAWRRTVRTLQHKQNPERVAQARAELATLKKRPPPGR
jgi:transposase